MKVVGIDVSFHSADYGNAVMGGKPMYKKGFSMDRVDMDSLQNTKTDDFHKGQVKMDTESQIITRSLLECLDRDTMLTQSLAGVEESAHPKEMEIAISLPGSVCHGPTARP